MGDDSAQRIKVYLDVHLRASLQSVGFPECRPTVELGGSRRTGLAHAKSDYDYFVGVPLHVAERGAEVRRILGRRLVVAGIVPDTAMGYVDQRDNNTIKSHDDATGRKRLHVSLNVSEAAALDSRREWDVFLWRFYDNRPLLKQAALTLAGEFRSVGIIAQEKVGQLIGQPR